MKYLVSLFLFAIAAFSQNPFPPGGVGGTCGALGGDVSGTCAASVVQKINGATPASVATSGNYNDLVNLPTLTTSTPGFSPNQTLAGCGVEYTTGLSFTIGACSYTISGNSYSTGVTNKTLTTADPSNPRIDVIGVDNTSAVFVLTGTPNANPVQPTIDPSTQLALTFVLVPAGSTTPSNSSQTLLYDENTEWTCTPTANINCASTNNPYHGTKDIEATSAVLNNNFTLVKPAAGTTNLSTVNTLVFYIRSKAQWPTGTSGANAARYISLSFLNGSAQVGNQVVLRDGAFGFSSAVTTNYQQISIPIGLFGTGTNLVTTLKASISGPSGSASIGWYIDEVTLQAGNTSTSLPTTLMNLKNAWTSTAAYNTNDVVTNSNVTYAALQPNTNQTPPNASYWLPLSTYTVSRQLGISFNGNGSALSGTLTGCTRAPYSGSATGWYVWADVSGSATIGVRTVAFGSYTGTAGYSGYTDVVNGGTAPSLTSAAQNSSTTMTNWLGITQGNIYCVQVTSPATATVLNVVLAITATN